ncbi:hypothetical protein Slin15195_G107980 [Septoria linicola]|uniref:Uncharacterized protein n=1 Tax=Septoria linicola TaxID=215465 RepID=A0A9Q9EPA9_9PEZI|nr:hypothetical protein Slin14017_G106280 [Septoria linicola]USW57479.1 hypothetical protein Slin15195_G107980 [Septoria linicola]
MKTSTIVLALLAQAMDITAVEWLCCTDTIDYSNNGCTSLGVGTGCEEPSRLLALPRELRDMIIDHTFTDTVVEVYSREDRSAGRTHTAAARNAGLLLTCTQLYAETKKPYFQKSIFHACEQKFMEQFPSGLEVNAVEERKAITKLHCEFDGGGWYGYRQCTRPSHGECGTSETLEFRERMRSEPGRLMTRIDLYDVPKSAVIVAFTVEKAESRGCMYHRRSRGDE